MIDLGNKLGNKTGDINISREYRSPYNDKLSPKGNGGLYPLYQPRI